MITKTLLRPNFIVILSGILAGSSVVFQSPLLSLTCLIPLFWILCQKKRFSFKEGVLFGFTIASFLFAWMIEGAERFTGSGLFYGVAAFLLSAGAFSFFWGAVLFLLGRFYASLSKQNVWLAGLLVSAFWTLSEDIFFLFITGLPWFGFRVGYGLSSNLLALQYAGIGGAGFISFIGVFLNYLTARLLWQKKIGQLWMPGTAAAVFTLGGWLLLSAFKSSVKNEGSVKAVIATQNIAPEEKWNENTGNTLAGQLIQLSKTAATHRPQLLVWTESILPWTYKPNDDLVKELLQNAPGAAQLIGMNTEAEATTVYNSAYYLQPGEKAAAVYHKQQPLAFIEKPLLGVLLPFLSGGGYGVKEGKNSAVMETGFGKIGMLICNEAAIPGITRAAALEGAQFFINISNDGWFSDSYLAAAHWQHARLRAVETRKDVVANSNKGYSGLIQASGETEQPSKSDEPVTVPLQIRKNSMLTLYTRLPFLIPFFCLSFILLYITGFYLFRKSRIAE